MVRTSLWRSHVSFFFNFLWKIKIILGCLIFYTIYRKEQPAEGELSSQLFTTLPPVGAVLGEKMSV